MDLLETELNKLEFNVTRRNYMKISKRVYGIAEMANDLELIIKLLIEVLYWNGN